MKIDHELKQRLTGAVVVTALAAIFIPMLFDDPIQENSQLVTNLPLPTENQFVEDDNSKFVPTSQEAVTTEIEEIPVTSGKQNSQIKKTVSEEGLEIASSGYTPPQDEEEEQPITKPVLKPKKPQTTANVNPSDATKKIKSDEVIVPIDDAVKEVAPVVPEVVTPKSTTTNSTLSTKRIFIQVGSFSKKENADTLSENLRKQGFPTIIEPVQTEKGTTYRLRIGPELDKKRADDMKRKLDAQNVKSIVISE